ncbi:MAG: hypothetical protein Q4D32_10270 [Eubacteriales bacterium]|nr:hypothetical protein [Eubacteriales bacterium]
MVKIIRRVVIVLFGAAAALSVLAWIKSSGLNDTDGPEIVMDQDSISVNIDCTDEELLAGITATDKKDGDVTDSLVVEDMSNFIEKGRRQVTVAAFDKDNNVTKATREVVYNDYVSPRFSLGQPLRFDMNKDYDVSSLFQVQDCLDGNLSGDVTVKSDSYYALGVSGECTMTFQVSNSAGDVVELPVTVEFYDSAEDNTAPKVELSEYLVYVSSGGQIDPMDYVAGMIDGGTFWELDDRNNPYDSDDIEIVNPVDTSVPGVYEISYTIPTEESYQPKIRLIVIVE